MNHIDIENAKNIVDALRIDGGSYLYAMCYHDFLSITFGDETNIFNLQDGNIYYHSDLVTTINDVPSIIQKTYFNKPSTNPGLDEMVHAFLKVLPFLFDSRGFLIMTRSFDKWVMCLGYDGLPDAQHMLWESIDDSFDQLYNIVHNLNAYIYAKETLKVNDSINKF